MTHRFPSSLLEDFVDQEMSEQQADEFRRLLTESPELERQCAEAERLRALMRQMPTPDPGDEYFSEVTELILARTGGMSRQAPPMSSGRAATVEQRRAFFRSLVSAAAALLIFFTAVLVGTSRNQQRAGTEITAGDVLVTAGLADRLDGGIRAVMTETEFANASVGMLLLGSPSHVGRFSILPTWFDAP